MQTANSVLGRSSRAAKSLVAENGLICIEGPTQGSASLNRIWVLKPLQQSQLLS